MRLRWALETNVGRVRSSNQDAVAADGRLFVVADGMGGHVGGEVASALAIAAIRQAVEAGAGAVEALVAANGAILERAHAEPELAGMGTTATLALIDSDGRCELASVGDSRAYLLHDGELRQLTSDHTFVQELVDAGTITSEQAAIHQARHVLTRVLGVVDDVQPDRFEVQLEPGDVVLLCSDGLVNEVDEHSIAEVLASGDPERAVRTLIDTALLHGGSDNVSVVVVTAEADHGATGAAARREARREARERARSQEDPPARTLATQLPRPLPAQLTDRPTLMRSVVRLGALLLALTAVAAAVVLVVALYNDHSYIVVLDHGRVVIEQGRLGGILWFRPHVVELTSLGERQLTPGLRIQLVHGVQEGSLAAARALVANLIREAAAQHAALSAVRLPLGGGHA